jgi:glycosyltransferase involved in cell wall biosynthesis
MFVSVIVPVYNSAGVIAGCIRSLLDQEYSKEGYEIIIVDDGSTDNTKDVVSTFKGVRFIPQPHAGPATARNLGASHAKGDVILFTDADCIPDSDWIKRMVEPFSNPGVAGVSGTYRTLNSNNLIARFVGYEIAHRHARMSRFDSIDFIGTAYAGYRKTIFREFGGFDTGFSTSSGEDPDLSFRIAAAGHRLVFQPQAAVAHRHPESFRAYLRQKFWRAYWRVRLYGKHPSKIGGESYTPPLLIPQAALTAAAVPAIVVAPLIGVSCLLLAIAVNLPFYAFVARREFVAGLASVPITLMRNLAFAAGAAAGLLRLR